MATTTARCCTGSWALVPVQFQKESFITFGRGSYAPSRPPSLSYEPIMAGSELSLFPPPPLLLTLSFLV